MKRVHCGVEVTKHWDGNIILSWCFASSISDGPRTFIVHINIQVVMLLSFDAALPLTHFS